ncbi:hypothetical protein [Paraburkholderia bannensis]|uniref:hypothetical protein n=1 Tax=Paraburkholderia bannensis TaxID=765414 RepID=UPI002AB05334|nr:hypothetical protein [Paraburkholderia bannensis]
MSEPACAVFSEERRRFLRWLRAFERVARVRPAGLSRWYRGRIITVYCRSGTFGIRMRGGHGLCLASIEVSPEFCGKGFFASLVAALRNELAFPFDRIEIEAVQNDSFAIWLVCNGFQRIDGTGSTGGAGSSFNLNLSSALTAASDPLLALSPLA